MDLRKDGYHAHIKLSGVKEAIILQGSIIAIFGELLKQLQLRNPRTTGDKEINIVIANHPITPALLEDSIMLSEVESMIDTSAIQLAIPEPHETLTEFEQRLLNDGCDRVTANILAREAFMPGTKDSNWISDPVAQKFRQLHASQTTYDAADPHELASLLAYCKQRYPNYLSGMQLRS